MHDGRFPALGAAILAAYGTLASALASLAMPQEKLLDYALVSMAGGFLFFVRKWMNDREKADREMLDMFRAHCESQAAFEKVVIEFTGLVKGKLGLHSHDSDPGERIAEAKTPAT